MTYPYSGDSVAMQQSLGPFDGTDPIYNPEEFSNAITEEMVTPAGRKETDSPFQKT